MNLLRVLVILDKCWSLGSHLEKCEEKFYPFQPSVRDSKLAREIVHKVFTNHLPFATNVIFLLIQKMVSDTGIKKGIASEKIIFQWKSIRKATNRSYKQLKPHILVLEKQGILKRKGNSFILMQSKFNI